MNTDIQPVSPQRAAHAPLTTQSSGPQVRTQAAENQPTDSRPAKLSSAQSRANIHEAVDKLNRQMQQTNQKLSFSVDDASDRVVIKVQNTITGEVVRQIPDESLLRVAHNIEDIKGLLHNATS